MASKICASLMIFFLIVTIMNKCKGSCTPKYDYTKLMEMNLKFFKAQRSGELPDNDIPWRESAFVNEEGDSGDDLAGGYFDAGDTLKLNYKGAHVATTLAWSLLEFKDGYDEAGVYEDAWEALKWQTDFLLKCYKDEDGNEYIYAQCGDASEHRFWENPNRMEKLYNEGGEGEGEDRKILNRVCYKVYHEPGKEGTDLAAEMAATFAASYLVFKDISGQNDYANTLLTKSEKLYDLAKNGARGIYSDHVKNASAGSSSLGYYDDLAWAAAWLYKATDKTEYLNYAKYRFRDSRIDDRLDFSPQEYSWANKVVGIALLMSQISSSDATKAKNHVKKYCHWLKYTAERADNSAHSDLEGMVWLNDILPARRIAKQVSTCLILNKYFPDDDDFDYTKFATRQIHLLVGDAKSSEVPEHRQSYVVGFAKNSNTESPKRPHHRAASCPTGKDNSCGFDERDSTNANPHELTGGLVGGPTKDGKYTDDRSEHWRNEVSITGMAGFQASLAGLLRLQKEGTCHYGSSKK